MSRRQWIKTGIMIMIVATIVCLSNSAVFANDNNRYMVTGLTFESDDISAEKAIDFTVHVLQSVDEEVENIELSDTIPAENAVVKALFLKNNIERDVTLTHQKEGNYKGQVTLPIDGEWNMVVVAMGEGDNQKLSAEQLSKDADNILISSFTVDEATTDGSFLWKALLVIVSIIVLIWSLKRLEPRLKKSQAKTKLKDKR